MLAWRQTGAASTAQSGTRGSTRKASLKVHSTLAGKKKVDESDQRCKKPDSQKPLSLSVYQPRAVLGTCLAGGG